MRRRTKRNVTQKILAHHLVEGGLEAGREIGIRIDQVLLQDHTGTQAMLHFLAMAFARAHCPLAVCYADHNVLQFRPENMEDHLFLRTVCRKYGLWFAKPGAGICHQVHLENFSTPGDTLIGADSHTPHCGGAGMLAIGAGGLDVAAALGSGLYYFDMPRIVGVRVVGELGPWCSAKDVALELLRRLGVQGGIGRILEFTGSGIPGLNLQERVTITNMCTELGATSAVFPSDSQTRDYLSRLGREEAWRPLAAEPGAGYDENLEIDLTSIEPLVAKPPQPDNVVPVSEVAGTSIDQIMVGSCTNGSYTDLHTVAEILRGRRVHPEVMFFVHPSSAAAVDALAIEGLLSHLVRAGVEVAQPTCGACIGIGHVPAPGTRSLRAINRNFTGRSGLHDDAVYLCSAETAAASALTGVIADPREVGRELGIVGPVAALHPRMAERGVGLLAPADEQEAARLDIVQGANIVPMSTQEPVSDPLRGQVLIKVGDDVSTDAIMPASLAALPFRSNVPRISDFVFERVDPSFSARARRAGGGWILAGHNYGQGSSREHAALAPRHLGVFGVVAKSYARIHHRNLVNAGILPLVFDRSEDYEEIGQGDSLEIRGLYEGLASGRLMVIDRDLGRAFGVHADLSRRQREVVLTGGLSAHVKWKAGGRPGTEPEGHLEST